MAERSENGGNATSIYRLGFVRRGRTWVTAGFDEYPGGYGDRIGSAVSQDTGAIAMRDTRMLYHEGGRSRICSLVSPAITRLNTDQQAVMLSLARRPHRLAAGLRLSSWDHGAVHGAAMHAKRGFQLSEFSFPQSGPWKHHSIRQT